MNNHVSLHNPANDAFFDRKWLPVYAQIHRLGKPYRERGEGWLMHQTQQARHKSNLIARRRRCTKLAKAQLRRQWPQYRNGGRGGHGGHNAMSSRPWRHA